MGELIYLFRDGRLQDKNGQTSNARMLERLGTCTFEQPERESWVFTFETTVPASWFKQNVRFVHVGRDGQMLAAAIDWIESESSGVVNVYCDWPVPFRQLGDTSRVPQKPGMYIVTNTDEWRSLAA